MGYRSRACWCAQVSKASLQVGGDQLEAARVGGKYKPVLVLVPVQPPLPPPIIGSESVSQPDRIALF
jgi:hypothetical protein